jgi:hypothetical protein
MSIELETLRALARADTADTRDHVNLDRLARRIEHKALHRVSPADVMTSSLPNPWLDDGFKESKR